MKNSPHSKSIIKLNIHKCKGGIPNFHINPNTIKLEMLTISKYRFIITIKLIMIKIEAKDWIKKYFILIMLKAFSTRLSPIIGIKINKLISIKPHKIIGLFKESPNNDVKINITVKMYFLNQAILILF